MTRHRHQEFVGFLNQVAKIYPREPLHLVCIYATHKHPTVGAWLPRHFADHPALHPTSGSWLDMVEIFFGIITAGPSALGAEKIAGPEVWVGGSVRVIQPRA